MDIEIIKETIGIGTMAIITINGNYNGRLTDPTIEILLTFQHIKHLTLNSIYINNEKLTVLNLNKYNTLILENCTLIKTKDSRLTRLFLDQGKELESLQIAFRGFSTNMMTVIKELILNIQLIHVITPKISLVMNMENLKMLLTYLPKSKTLKHLTIFRIRNENNIGENEFLNRLKIVKIEIDIQEFDYYIPRVENKHWYR